MFVGYTKLYGQREKAEVSFEITNEAFCSFFGMLLLSGGRKIPDWKMYWERPIYWVINELNKRFLKFCVKGKNKSINESTISYHGTYWSRQRINDKPIWMGYYIWVLVDAYGCVVQFEPYQDVKKGIRKTDLLLY